MRRVGPGGNGAPMAASGGLFFLTWHSLRGLGLEILLPADEYVREENGEGNRDTDGDNVFGDTHPHPSRGAMLGPEPPDGPKQTGVCLEHVIPQHICKNKQNGSESAGCVNQLPGLYMQGVPKGLVRTAPARPATTLLKALRERAVARVSVGLGSGRT